MDFATWVQSQIDEFGITIYQISKRSGVHASTIANWLNGAKPQDAKAKAVKIAVEDIIEEKQALSSGSLPPEGTKKAPAAKGKGSKEAASNFIKATNDRAALLALINEATKKLQELE